MGRPAIILISKFSVPSSRKAFGRYVGYIARKEALESLCDMMVYSKNHTKIPFERLLRVKDWDEFKKLLKSSL